MKDIAKEILSACILNRSEFKKERKEYLQHNEELAVDILNLLDGVKEYLESLLQIKLDTLQDSPMAPVENDPQGTITSLDYDNADHKLAISLLGETSKKGYERVRKTANENPNVDVPSFHTLTKNRPDVEEIVLNIGGFNPNQDTNSSYIMQQLDDEYEATVSEDTVQELSDLSIVSNGNVDDLVQFSTSSSNQVSIQGSKLKGKYSDYIDLIKSKHKSHGRVITSEENKIVIDSFDGAEHLRSKKNITNIISFSTSLHCPSWILEGKVSAGSSLNILTWQQIMASENHTTIMCAVQSYFQQRKRLSDELVTKSYHFYDLHDGKMLYLLTQHSMWNRKNRPFLLCSCERGEGVKNNNSHVCKTIGEEK